ncbi:unnamed protein product [Diplocarpon coronariae]|uniref:Zinc finger protein n=1 Tax=Diplocarpon coronariae TaxID=2795749 RepID=A0A218Z1I9_9HELO|nr:zinc finger protein [Marssonina coronariae]
MSCLEIYTFYRICGHSVQGLRHTGPCHSGAPRRDNRTCWNPLPNKVERHYIVGYCPPCFDRALIFGEVPEEILGHDPGEFTIVQNPGTHSRAQIRSNAREAREQVENYEKPLSRTHARQRELQENALMQQNEWEWSQAAKDFLRRNPLMDGETQVPEGCLLLDNFANIACPPFLRAATNNLDGNICAICRLPLLPTAQEIADESEEEQLFRLEIGDPRILPCSDLHAFHHGCIMRDWDTPPFDQAFRRCPVCRKAFRPMYRVLRFGEPEYRWYPVENRYWQVGGYFPFTPTHPEQLPNFKRNQVSDRWGDLI